MRIFFGVICLLSITACGAQPARKVPASTTSGIDTVVFSEKVYSSATFGLSMRDAPNATAAVISKIPYGTQIIPFKPLDPNESPVSSAADTITIDGMPTYWVKVRVGGKTGYVTDAYISDYAPPPAAAMGIKEWAEAIGKPYGKPFYGRPRVQTLQQDGVAIFRQLYNNGAVYTEGSGYEDSYQSLQLPGTSILKVYNCIKLLKDFEEVFKANTTLRRGQYKIPRQGSSEGYDWNVEYTGEAGASWIKSITISWSGEGYNSLTIANTEGDVVVTYSTGV